MDPAARQRLLDVLAEMRAAYVARVSRWPGANGQAEDVVQDAFLRAAASASALRDEARGEEWFFHVLRSAYVDHRRRSDVRRRLRTAVAIETMIARQLAPAPPELGCMCLRRGLSALRPEYRRALEVVVLDERSLSDLAEAAGITLNNAGVRVHRARAALARVARACCRGCRVSPDGCSCGL